MLRIPIFIKTLDFLKEVHETQLCPIVVPYMEGGVVQAYVNLMAQKAFTYQNGKATEVPVPQDARIAEMINFLKEAVATTDDELMEKFFDGAEFTQEEIIRGLQNGHDGRLDLPCVCLLRLHDSGR